MGRGEFRNSWRAPAHDLTSYKFLFSRAPAANADQLDFRAHTRHPWPDIAYAAQMDAIASRRHVALATRDAILIAQRNLAHELHLSDSASIRFDSSVRDILGSMVRGCAQQVSVLTNDQTLALELAGSPSYTIVTPAHPFATFTDRFVAAIYEHHPDLVVVSHVTYDTGFRVDDLDAIAFAAMRCGARVIVDVRRTFMALPIDFGALADQVCLVGDFSAYAMGGGGAAFLHAPSSFGLEPKLRAGSRFDYNALARFNAARRALYDLALETGAIAQRTTRLRAILVKAIAAGQAGALQRATIIDSNASGLPSGFVTLRHASADKWDVKLRSVGIAVDVDESLMRIGLGLYHDEADLDAFCERAATLDLR